MCRMNEWYGWGKTGRQHGTTMSMGMGGLLWVVVSVTWVTLACGAFSGSDYGTRFHGDGTYYGQTDGGNCAMGKKGLLPRMYQRMLPVAINEEQYANSASCGACIEMTGNGKGIGDPRSRIVNIYHAYVHDRCPECKKGDLDLSKSGDGRWQISWKFIPCPGNDASFVFEGCNTFYKKIQVRGLKFPPIAMKIDGVRGARSQDNFFIANPGRPFPGYGRVEVLDVKLNAFKGTINLNIAAGVLQAPASFNGGNGGARPTRKPRPPRRPAPRPPRRPVRPRCVAAWKRCSGPYLPRHKGCCGRHFRCIGVRWSRYRHCMYVRPRPRHKSCIPKYEHCGASRRRSWGPRCCGNFVCRKPRGWRWFRCVERHRK